MIYLNNSKEELKKVTKQPHNLTLEGRKELAVSGVKEVENFDDRSIFVQTTMGNLNIKGQNLNIKKLDLELGDLEVDGKISALIYSEKNSDSSEGFFSKLFK